LGLVDLVLERLGLELDLGLRDVGLGLRDLLLGVGDRLGHVLITGIGLEHRQQRVELFDGLDGLIVVLLVVPVLNEFLLV
jgi:hypothetical protein